MYHSENSILRQSPGLSSIRGVCLLLRPSSIYGVLVASGSWYAARRLWSKVPRVKRCPNTGMSLDKYDS
jgi:hypothetical protein